jgi:hypothetical protein
VVPDCNESSRYVSQTTSVTWYTAYTGTCCVSVEIVKIRLQLMGELARKEGAVKRGAVHVIRSLGLVGLYTGVTSCLARDGEPPRLDVLCPVTKLTRLPGSQCHS